VDPSEMGRCFQEASVLHGGLTVIDFEVAT